MKYFIEDYAGNLVKRHWCDNPDCPHWVSRGAVTPIVVELENGKEYCSKACEQQIYLKERKGLYLVTNSL